MPDFKWLTIEAQDEVALVTLHRPGDRNSINSSVMLELAQALDLLESGGQRAVIFTGGGPEYFIGGADGIEMMQCAPEQAFDFSRRFQKMLDRLEASPFITLAAINGLCFGGGFEFAMACDLRVAGEKARIGLPEVKVGIIPGGGGTQRLPALVGKGLAMEMILTGQLYPGREAAAMGLVNHCLPDDGLLDGAKKLLAKVLKQPQYALLHAKAAVTAWPNLPQDQGLLKEAEEFSQCFNHHYFPSLMKKQLKAGVLQTTAPLPRGFLEEE